MKTTTCYHILILTCCEDQPKYRLLFSSSETAVCGPKYFNIMWNCVKISWQLHQFGLQSLGAWAGSLPGRGKYFTIKRHCLYILILNKIPYPHYAIMRNEKSKNEKQTLCCFISHGAGRTKGDSIITKYIA